MKFKLLVATVIAASLVSTSVYAQDQPAADAPPPPPSGWQKDVVAKLAGSQVGFSNWQGGGINSLAFTAGIDGEAKKESARWKQKFNGRLGIGAVKQDTLSLRKAEDLILLSYSLRYKGKGFFGKWNPTLAAELRTQALEGFDYGEQPALKVSDFFAPAFVTQAIGLTYSVDDWFTQRFGIGAKETVVTIERLRPLYMGDDIDSEVRFEAGLESNTTLKRELVKNVVYKSSLSLFAAFNQPDKPDAIWENLITMKINDWLQTNFELVLLFDDDVSRDVQLKEVFSVGVAFVLI